MTRGRAWPYFFLMMDLRLWYTSEPMRMASVNELAPTGRIMNSCAHAQSAHDVR